MWKINKMKYYYDNFRLESFLCYIWNLCNFTHFVLCCPFPRKENNTLRRGFLTIFSLNSSNTSLQNCMNILKDLSVYISCICKSRQKRDNCEQCCGSESVSFLCIPIQSVTKIGLNPDPTNSIKNLENPLKTGNK